MQNGIRQLREEKGWSQARLGGLVGLSQPQIDRLEKGSRRLSDVWIDRFVKVFDVPLNALLLREEENPASISQTAKPSYRSSPSYSDEALDKKKIIATLMSTPKWQHMSPEALAEKIVTYYEALSIAEKISAPDIRKAIDNLEKLKESQA